MNVNWPFEALSVQKAGKWILAVVLLSILVLSVTQLKEESGDDWQAHELEIALRSVGHQLLIQSGDLSTVVPPVKKPDERTLRLNLPYAMTIKPDSLSQLSINVFGQTLVSHVIVNVYSQPDNEMVYGFELDSNDEHEIPCLGRDLPKANYYIDLILDEPATADNNYQLAMMGMAGIGLALMLFSGLPRANKASGTQRLEVAGFVLNGQRTVLSYQGTEVELTKRELSLATILMENAGELVTRDYLVEQVWSKEGVVTGRSLDVFISRLRKKFAINPKVQIVNKHGKGYVLKVDSGPE